METVLVYEMSFVDTGCNGGEVLETLDSKKTGVIFS